MKTPLLFSFRRPAAPREPVVPDWVPKGTTFTGTPGQTFCSPSRITRSPGFSPWLTSHLSPMDRSTTRSRCAYFVGGVHYHGGGLPFAIAGYPLLRD